MYPIFLPIEEQKALAEKEGLSFEEWEERQFKIIDEENPIETIHLTGKEAEDYLKEHKHFYERVFT